MPKYSADELDGFAIDDLRRDAERAEAQAAAGPFYPEKGVTAEMLTAYAAKCRRAIEKYKDGGAHKAVLAGFCTYPVCKCIVSTSTSEPEPKCPKGLDR